MRKIILGFLLLSTTHAFAADEIYAYNFWAYDAIKKYTAEISASPAINASPVIENGVDKCLPVFKNPIKNGVFDIHYALGYFDDSQAIDILWNNNNYGLSPSLDIGMFKSIIHALTDPCTDRAQLDLCGFRMSGNPDMGKVILEKNISLLGNNVLTRITLTQASASESYNDNLNKFQDRQRFLTEQSEENYFGAIGNADVVIYNGHSRNGGGPDFNPPRLNQELHVNYDGYYKVKRPGINHVIEQIKKGSNKDSILTFFSCFSKKHFYDDLLKANPKQKLVLSAETIDYFDSLKASMGYLEGLMHGSCGQELADIAKQGDKIKNGFQGFQIK